MQVVRREDVTDLASQLLGDLRREVVGQTRSTDVRVRGAYHDASTVRSSHGRPDLDHERADQRQPQPVRSEPVSRDDEVENSGDREQQRRGKHRQTPREEAQSEPPADTPGGAPPSMDRGSTDRASARLANAVAATSTPLRSSPFGSEKTVLTPSRCSASAVTRTIR